jgi:predicted transcriptional regulator YdeE
MVEGRAFTFVGTVGTAKEVAELDIADLWQRFGALNEGVENEVEGAGYELHIALEHGRHCLCGVEVSGIGAVPLGAFATALPPCDYAVFTHRLVDGYDAVYTRINAWLESSDYEEAGPYDFQLYDSRFTSMDDPESVQEIWVPVRRAQ